MCELLGITSNYEVLPSFSFKEIKLRSMRHRDGWGVGFYKNGLGQLIKEPFAAYRSEKAKSIENGNITGSGIFIIHIRYGTSGSNKLENTHPFMHELFGQTWIFAHNGVVGNYTTKSGIFKERLVDYKPVGQTDSEYAFCYILDKLKKECGKESELEEIVKSITSSAEHIKKYGSFNFLLSNGEYLFAFGDTSLHYLSRNYENNEIQLKDADYSINITTMKRPDEQAVIIATSPLTKNEKWNLLKGLKIFKDGKEKI